MSVIRTLCLLLLLSGLALAQTTVIGGTASYWAPPGIYAAPFVPMIVTPSISLSAVAPSPVGASNSAFGNVAGATNSTLSSEFIGQPSSSVYTQPVWLHTEPVWYGLSSGPEVSAESAVLGQPVAPSEGPAVHRHRGHGNFDFAIAAQGAGVAQLMSGQGAARKASRTYTNQDTDRQNQNNGVVKYDNKTEHI